MTRNGQARVTHPQRRQPLQPFRTSPAGPVDRSRDQVAFRSAWPLSQPDLPRARRRLRPRRPAPGWFPHPPCLRQCDGRARAPAPPPTAGEGRREPGRDAGHAGPVTDSEGRVKMRIDGTAGTTAVDDDERCPTCGGRWLGAAPAASPGGAAPAAAAAAPPPPAAAPPPAPAAGAAAGKASESSYGAAFLHPADPPALR
eukprot:gene15675-biopygen7110